MIATLMRLCDSASPCVQLQLNVTWIGPRGPPAYLTYAWNDYPRAMSIISADGFRLPVGPFNASVNTSTNSAF